MLDRIYTVYKITSPEGKSYIGRTKNYKARLRHHKCLTSGCHDITVAIREYGWENFNHEILFENITLIEANALEEWCINVTHNTLYPNGYNLRSGGINDTHCAEFKARNSISQKGKIISEETKIKMSLNWLIIHPDGYQEEITNLKSYCKKHNLSYDCVNAVYHGRQSNHKGYICYKIT